MKDKNEKLRIILSLRGADDVGTIIGRVQNISTIRDMISHFKGGVDVLTEWHRGDALVKGFGIGLGYFTEKLWCSIKGKLLDEFSAIIDKIRQICASILDKSNINIEWRVQTILNHIPELRESYEKLLNFCW